MHQNTFGMASINNKITWFMNKYIITITLEKRIENSLMSVSINSILHKN